MAQLIICSKNKKNNLKDRICNTLSKNKCTEYLREDKNNVILNVKGNNTTKVVILDYNSFCNVYKGKEFIYIVSSADKKSIKKLINIQSPVITCGTSSKDTISLASINGGTAVVSLQRKIENLYGETIEPMDIKIELDTTDNVYHALATCTVSLLCGIEN